MHLPKLSEEKSHMGREIVLFIVILIFLFSKCHGDISVLHQ